MTTEAAPEAVLEELAQSMAGLVTHTGGLWVVNAGTYSPPVLALTEDLQAGAIEVVQAGTAYADLFNGVRGRMIARLGHEVLEPRREVPRDPHRRLRLRGELRQRLRRDGEARRRQQERERDEAAMKRPSEHRPDQFCNGRSRRPLRGGSTAGCGKTWHFVRGP